MDISDKDRARFFKSVASPDENGCCLWTGSKFRDGYGSFSLHGKRVLAHRIAYLIHHRNLPNHLFVLHHCDVHACVNPSHLFLGTHEDNMADMDSKSRRVTCPGERNGRAKLTPEEVIEIREIKKSGLANRSIAKLFGIGRQHVGRIVRGTTWKQE